MLSDVGTESKYLLYAVCHLFLKWVKICDLFIQMIFVPLIGMYRVGLQWTNMDSNVRGSVQYYSTTPQDQADCVEWLSQCIDNQFNRHIFFFFWLFPVRDRHSGLSVSILPTNRAPPNPAWKYNFYDLYIWIWHRLFTPDALPDTTLPNFSGLGQLGMHWLVYPRWLGSKKEAHFLQTSGRRVHKKSRDFAQTVPLASSWYEILQ